METLNGFYKADFSTPLGHGSGVVDLRNGTIRGGDSTMYYLGAYDAEEGRFTAEIEIREHSKDPYRSSVFGVSDANILISGNVTGDMISGSGTSPQAPRVEMSVILMRISD